MKHDPHAKPMARTLYKRGHARKGYFLAPRNPRGYPGETPRFDPRRVITI